MNVSEPALRVATPADADEIESLMKTSAAGLFPAFYGEQQVASGIRFVAEADPALLADGTYYVLEADGEMVACGGWSRRARPYTGSGESASDDRLLDPATEAAHVRAMFTRPDWTRRGLGRRILVECERAAAAEGFSRLDLVATLSGVPLYEAFGFVRSGPELEITLTDGVPMACLPMSKPIQAPVAAAGHADRF
jgi:GNAT superfamily N-acetyltransferase